MNILLDCDDVFDRLTRGPFPNGDADNGAVESHLRACHECRELAEALRPAVKLMREAYADAPQEDETLPVYRGEVMPAGGRELASPARREHEWSMGWQLVAASLLGVAIGAFALGGKMIDNDQVTASSPRTTTPGLTMLASLNLNDACLPSSMALASSERLRCCTDCHSSTAAHKRDVDVARLQLACVACHEPRHE
jgi:hypothetical protein